MEKCLLLVRTEQPVDAQLEIQARGFWERQGSAFFDVRVCYLNAESYKAPTTKKSTASMGVRRREFYACRVLEIEQDSLTPLVFTTTGSEE